jgi:integrase
LHADGLGLYLQVKGGARSWLFRYATTLRDEHGQAVIVTTANGVRLPKRKDTWVGLGPTHTVGLALARDRAQEMRLKLLDGIDVLAERRASKAQPPLRAMPTFAEMVDSCIEVKRPEWRSDKHAAQWKQTLKTYVYPYLDGGRLPVDMVTKDHVLAALRPIWLEKTETATRVRQRIEEVLAHAAAAGHRQPGSNPAAADGLRGLLPQASKVKSVRHHPALPVAMASAFYKRLTKIEGAGALALRFVMLCASRSGEVRQMTWGELDLAAKVWHLPAERTKTKKPLRVPLSAEAMRVLNEAKKLRQPQSHLVFPTLAGEAMSDATMAAVIKRMNESDGAKWVDKVGEPVVPHGLRSTFRDWAGDLTNYPRELVELCLGHAVATGTEGAYWRGDALDRRRPIMDEWSKWCAKSRR